MLRVPHWRSSHLPHGAVDWNMVEAIGTWFAGVATALALLLGFKIMRDDRKKEERDQAGKVAIFSKVLFWEPPPS